MYDKYWFRKVSLTNLFSISDNKIALKNLANNYTIFVQNGSFHHNILELKIHHVSESIDMSSKRKESHTNYRSILSLNTPDWLANHIYHDKDKN